MKVCVLQPDYSTTRVDYKNYDPPRNLQPFLPGHEVHHVFLNKLTTYNQLKALARENYDIFVNLCEGYLEWEVPSIDVIHSLELLNLPYTGPNATIYDPAKELMKYVAHCEGVLSPAYCLVESPEDLSIVERSLSYPLFIKPAKAGDSLGIDEGSAVHDNYQLREKMEDILQEYGPLLVEQYIDGREFTVLVAADPNGRDCRAYHPVEYRFPEGRSFKTYALKTSELHPDCNIRCEDPVLAAELMSASERIFKGFNGVGYARLDFRVDRNNTIYFLEINFTCSVFYTEGYEGSADFILRYSEGQHTRFLLNMIEEGIARHQRKQKVYRVRGNSIAGFGIYASKNILEGDIIFTGEERSQRIVTRRFVETNWNEDQKLSFRRYAYALSEEVFILWDNKPEEWAPQNHSCNANTVLDGLNVVASRDIQVNEELTLDYSGFLDESMEPFHCNCKSANCKGIITGTPSNTVTTREQRMLIGFLQR